VIPQPSAVEIAERVRAGETPAVAFAERALAAISERDAGLGAFLHVDRDAVLAAARAVDEKRARGERLGALAGVPVAVKDALATHDAPTTSASRILVSGAHDAPAERRRPFRPPYDATVVARLRAEDAVIVGKTNMDEMAMGSSTENSAFFPAKNPHDPTRVPGGSSGGSAVAVAAGMAALALGSDTGGSIRQPAALTGVVGFKPSYGRVSRYGLFAFASSLDQVGTFAPDVRGAALGLEAIAGVDPADSTSSSLPVPSLRAVAPAELRGLRVGISDAYLGPGVEPGVRARIEAALDALRRHGALVVPVDLATTKYAVATYYVLCTAEASSNLARYDGVRFGAREDASSLAELYAATRGAGFGREVKRRIVLGTFVLSSGYYDAYYLRAQRARTLIRRDFDRAFEAVDVIATPTSPTVAWKLGAKMADPLSMYLADVFTLPASLAGLPGISLPCGTARATDAEVDLPVGLQLIAPPFAEERLVSIALAVEAVLG
jgi:aspartyl-tRNA(Asn)/glutamyl-tRNA(Gln) amidotransferase subunit A